MPRGVSWWHLCGDALAVLAGFYLAHLLRFGLIAAPKGLIPLDEWMRLAALSLPLWLAVAALHGLYYTRLKQSFAAELASVTHMSAEGLLATILLTFTIRGLPDSRMALVLAVALSWLLAVLYRAAARRLRRSRPRAVVIGDSPHAEYLRRQFAGRATRFELAAAYATPDDFVPEGCDAVFCDANQAAALWERLPLGPCDFAVYLLPEAGLAGSASLAAATVEGVPTLSVKSAQDLQMMRQAKRVLDLIGGSVLLVLSLPFWLLSALAILLTSPGPLFYAHNRIGLFGRPFRLLKFRSMVRDADKLKVELEGFDERYKLANDPRITPVGRVLRKLSLDELPQLLNILRGELSLVGPRPIVAGEAEKYGVWAGLLGTVPPGLTGLWQVSGRSAVSYQQRIDFDLFYINNWSLGLDLLILLRTIPAVLSRRGAY